MTQKCKLLLQKCSLMVQTKKNPEKWLSLKYTFMVLIKQNLKSVCYGKQGFCCQDDQNEW